MKRTPDLPALVLATLAVGLVVGLVAVFSTAAETTATQPMTKEQLISRGNYLVSFGGCHDCHSPKIMTDKGPVPDPKRLLSGHPADSKLPQFTREEVAPGKWVLFNGDLTACVGPWGVTYAFNLTPDDNTGTGLWTEEMFVNAMRTGKHMGMGRMIQPPMPWMNVAGLTDEDLRAIYAYLRSIPQVKNAIPGPMSLDEYLSITK